MLQFLFLVFPKEATGMKIIVWLYDEELRALQRRLRDDDDDDGDDMQAIQRTLHGESMVGDS